MFAFRFGYIERLEPIETFSLIKQATSALFGYIERLEPIETKILAKHFSLDWFGYIERLEPIETVLDGYQNTIYKRKTQAKNYQKWPKSPHWIFLFFYLFVQEDLKAKENRKRFSCKQRKRIIVIVFDEYFNTVGVPTLGNIQNYFDIALA